MGQFRPNNFGLYDMIGNASEWCSDWFADDYYQNSPPNDPQGPPTGKSHLVRGGSFAELPWAADRKHFSADHRSPDCGFRVVCEIAGTPAGSSASASPGSPEQPPVRSSKHDARRTWKGAHSRFENPRPRIWKETTRDGKTFHFQEVSRTPEYVEMIDRRRAKGGVRVRLRDDAMLMIWGGRDADWRRTQEGEWESARSDHRSLGVAVGATSSPAAAPAANTADRRAAQSVLSLGGTVMLIVNGRDVWVRQKQDLPRETLWLARVDFAGVAALTDAALESLRGLAHLVSLNLHNIKSITDAGLEPLEHLPQLERLDLSVSSVSDAGLAHLEGLTQLNFLNLGRTRVGDAGLAHLQGLSQLETLWLNETEVGDAGLACLRGMKKLRSLIVWHSKVTDAGLVHLEGLKALEGVMLGGQPVTDSGLAHLAGLTGLKKLWLDETKVTDAGLAPLMRMTALQELNLRGTHISDAGLAHLENLKSLRQLGLHGTKVTAAGVEKLKKAIPACQIAFDSARR